MVATQSKPISFEEFLEWYPEDGKRYQLIEGVIVEMLPTGSHEDISGFLMAELNFEIRQQNLPCSIPKNCLRSYALTGFLEYVFKLQNLLSKLLRSRKLDSKL